MASQPNRPDHYGAGSARYAFPLRPVGDLALIYEIERRLQLKVLKLEKDYKRGLLFVEVDRKLTESELKVLSEVVESPPPQYEYLLEPPTAEEVKREIGKAVGVEPILVELSADGMVTRAVFTQRLTPGQMEVLLKLLTERRLRLREVVK
jgi:hypothetical protein